MPLAAQEGLKPSVAVYGGYSGYNPGGKSSGTTFGRLPHGFDSSAAIQFTPRYSLVADVSTFSDSKNGSARMYLFGPKFTFHRGPLSPFAQVTMGVQQLSPKGRPSYTAFAEAVGGGVDLTIARRFSLRLFQADFIYAVDHEQPGLQQNHFFGTRVSAGIAWNIRRPRAVVVAEKRSPADLPPAPASEKKSEPAEETKAETPSEKKTETTAAETKPAVESKSEVPAEAKSETKAEAKPEPLAETRAEAPAEKAAAPADTKPEAVVEAKPAEAQPAATENAPEKKQEVVAQPVATEPRAEKKSETPQPASTVAKAENNSETPQPTASEPAMEKKPESPAATQFASVDAKPATAPKPEPPQSEVAQSQPAKVEARNSDTAQTQATKPEAAMPEIAKAEFAKPEAAKTELAKAEPAPEIAKAETPAPVPAATSTASSVPAVAPVAPAIQKVATLRFPYDQYPTLLSPQDKRSLDAVASRMKLEPNSTAAIIATGRANSTTPAQRAINAKNELVKKGIAADRVQVVTRPLDTTARKPAASSTEIVFIPQGAKLDQAGATPVDEQKVKPQNLHIAHPEWHEK